MKSWDWPNMTFKYNLKVDDVSTILAEHILALAIE